MLPACATARRIWRSRSLSRRPIRSDHSIRPPVAEQLTAYRKIEILATAGAPILCTGAFSFHSPTSNGRFEDEANALPSAFDPPYACRIAGRFAFKQSAEFGA